MKLYSIHNSNNCRRVNATIAHLGLDVELVDPGFNGLKGPELLAVNPNGKVPALVDGDFKLWESRAIMQYLASKKPGNELWPSDPKRQADITRWQFWESSHLQPGTGAVAFEKLFKPFVLKQPTDEAAVKVGEKQFHAFAPVLNGHLEGKKFLVGDQLTLADFSVGACFSFAGPSGLPWDAYNNIKAWYARLSEVPAWKSTAPKLG